MTMQSSDKPDPPGKRPGEDPLDSARAPDADRERGDGPAAAPAAPPANPYASPQQLIYARWLDVCTRIGFLLLVVAFALYVSGVIPSHVPLEALPRYWSMPVAQYLAAVDGSTGWEWIHRLDQGDYLNIAGVAMLSAVSIVCHLPLVTEYWKTRDRAYLVMVVGQIVILVAAASGLVFSGH
jgi:4-amino-4-deoxy-L-arabinose transferase-like glycosyltransferase